VDDLNQDPGARLTVVGALRVVRFLPVLQVSGLPVIDEVQAIVMSRGRDPYANVERDATTVRRFADVGEDIPQDIDSPEYLQLIACDIVLAVAGIDWTEEIRRGHIEIVTRTLWKTCDDLVHEAGGYSLPVFRGMKTTLQGVEDIWRERDWAAVTSGVPLGQAFETMCREIQKSMVKRREIAEAVGRCAGWLESQPPHQQS
jgi:hypothetical protein